MERKQNWFSEAEQQRIKQRMVLNYFEQKQKEIKKMELEYHERNNII
jgi:hypothetical protein